ncbi:hypothetical protein CBS101457_003065 [Exobasidium rhododendri]|nr:hypothetical protein CBS101457_003065 [Exobasidium rhododendri]
MAREDIEFKSSDGVTLRGWFYPATAAEGKQSPCVILAHGWSATKEFDLDAFSEKFQAAGFNTVVFDHRGFGSSDHAPHAPRLEIVPHLQVSDYSDAITYAQNRKEVNDKKIAVWGSSYSGGHVLMVGATDKRVKAVISQRKVNADREIVFLIVDLQQAADLNPTWTSDRLSRAAGDKPAFIPVVDPDPMALSALPTADSWEFFNRVGNEGKAKQHWKNSVTLKSMELFTQYEPGFFAHLISPRPLLMVIADDDRLTPTDLAVDVYEKAKSPKQLLLLKDAGHFDGYVGKWFEQNVSTQVAFLKQHLLEA